MAVFDLILGPILMGTMMNVLLMGVMIVQCYVYFERYKGDKPWIKATVGFLLLLDALSSSFGMAMTYNYLVTNFGNVNAIQVTNTGIDPYPLLTGITALVVQSFFAWRIQVLTKSKLLAAIIAALSIVQMRNLGTMIGGLIVKEFVKLKQIKQISLIWLFGSVVTDAIITLSLVQFLRNKKTGFPSTDHLTSKIIRSTVQTGLLTTTVALGVVIAYLVSDSTMHLAFGLPLSKLYTNTLLSSLNARGVWNPEGYTIASHTTLHLPSGPQQYVLYVSLFNYQRLAVDDTFALKNENHEMKTYEEPSKHSSIV
ncbi:uncharacterized protein BT62DRAFT_992631 [Guyanagaster necrorhizus]|uniref:DUF6534 domain-containing protein n=1 Tax=Guyanagaster necrorhizus TaxID=856835 RepID=A0A9P8AUL8_9AGAR|nr:uncharacterized protein BT62DRAFT_992631 [Guyanagaster necrorhizus MCA 3950]KAG7448608.1 hypothetical protein BT62DRAFT_992631 [Guyanagaster necrorhizus MCA 3950]